MTKPVPYKGKDPYIFFSYSHQNSEQAYEIMDALKEYKFCVWYDDGIHPSTEWNDVIAHHVKGCTLFAALISKAYLDSKYCKIELLYAYKLGKQVLPICLEDVELPPTLDMLLSPLHAIYWYRCQNTQEAMKKFLETENVELCQDLAALKAQKEAEAKALAESRRLAEQEAARKAEQKAARKAQKEAEARAQAEAGQRSKQEEIENYIAAMTPEDMEGFMQELYSVEAESGLIQPEPALDENHPVKNTTYRKKRRKRKISKKVGIAVIAAVLVIAAGVIIASVIIHYNSNKASDTSASTQTSANPYNAAAETLKEFETADYQASLIWGSHVYNENVKEYLEFSSTEFQQMAMPDGDSYEMTRLPMQIVAAPDYPGYLLITFVDRYAVSYSFYGSYTLEGTALQISTGAPEDLDAALACWGAEDAAPLEKNLDYQFELYNGSYKIKTDSGQSVYLLPEGEATDRVVTLSGSASDSSNLYEEIAGLEVTINKDTLACDSDPVVLFADGGHTTDASMTSQLITIGEIYLSWTTEERPYNGRTENFDVDKTVNIHYYSTAPYGFVLVGNSHVYYYQSTASDDWTDSDDQSATAMEVNVSGDSISTSPLPTVGSGPAPDYYIIKTISSSGVALRNENTEDASEILGWLSNGSTVWVVDNTDDAFTYVYSPDLECYGYVHSNCLE